MKVLIDTNVALDYMLNRSDYSNAKIIYLMAEQKLIAGYISASAITDITHEVFPFIIYNERINQNDETKLRKLSGEFISYFSFKRPSAPRDILNSLSYNLIYRAFCKTPLTGREILHVFQGCQSRYS